LINWPGKHINGGEHTVKDRSNAASWPIVGDHYGNGSNWSKPKAFSFPHATNITPGSLWIGRLWLWNRDFPIRHTYAEPPAASPDSPPANLPAVTSPTNHFGSLESGYSSALGPRLYGNKTKNVHPLPISDSIQIRPPHLVTIFRQMAKPIPVPS